MEFGIFKGMQKTPDSPEQFFIGADNATKDKYPGKYPDLYVDTIDEILDYEIDGEKLRDIITKAEIIDCPLVY